MVLRKHFQERLDEIREDVLRMGAGANEMVRRAVEAALNADSAGMAEVIEADDAIDAAEREIVNQAMLAVMQESPVASDLRMLVCTLGVVGEIEKVGDHAVKFCRRMSKLEGRFPAEMKLALNEIGELSRRSFNGALRLYAGYDAELAEEVIRGDQPVDEAFRIVREQLSELIERDPQQTTALMRTIEAFHALEHVADHAVAIAVRLRMVQGSTGADSPGAN